MIAQTAKTQVTTTRLEGLVGWLILVGIGFCLAPVRILKTIVEGARAFEAQTWAVLTTPGTNAYHPLWAPVIIGETVLNVLLLGVSLVAIYLFFKKRRAFPRVAIAFLAAGFALVVVDLAVLQAIPPASAQLDASDLGDVARAGIGAVIWIPYFIRSRRVQATFTR
jgi:Protein of unknown function (DUF2569)